MGDRKLARPATEDLDLAIRDVALVRIERMDDGLIWLEVTEASGRTTTINLSSRAPIRHRLDVFGGDRGNL